MNHADVTIKLNKRDSQAIWVFDIRGTASLFIGDSPGADHSYFAQSQQDRPMSISHEVNVVVLTNKRKDELNEPLCPPPDVS